MTIERTGATRIGYQRATIGAHVIIDKIGAVNNSALLSRSTADPGASLKRIAVTPRSE